MWTPVSSSLDIAAYGVCWAEDLAEFVAVGQGTANAVHSVDGITWTAASSDPSTVFIKVARNTFLGLYIATDVLGRIWTSPDGDIWTDQSYVMTPTPGPSGPPAVSIACNQSTGTTVVGVQNYTISGTPVYPHNLARSTDGTTYAGVSSPFDGHETVEFGTQFKTSVGYSPTNNRWLAWASNLSTFPFMILAYSDDDGLTWHTSGLTPPSAWQTLPDLPTSNIYWDGSSNKWFLCGSDVTALAVSTNNGATWTEIATPLDSFDGNECSFGVIDIGGGVMGLAGTDSTNQIATSLDGGATWALDGDPAPFGAGQRAYDFAYSSTLPLAVVVGDGDTTIAYGIPSTSSVTPDAPPGVSFALTAGPLDDPVDWTRIDNLDGVRITGITIDRGRPDERSKTTAGTVTIKGVDDQGVLDFTNPSSPLFPWVVPMKQAAITLFNPVADEWKWLFRGTVTDFKHELDVAEKWYDFEITLTDMLDIFDNEEIVPDAAGNFVPQESQGDCYYTGQHCDDRILAALADTATAFNGQIWPASLLQIASGNVFVQGRAYSSKTALRQVLDEAVDADYPLGNNRFITKRGAFAFRGRFYRFSPSFFLAANDDARALGHEMVHWQMGDTAAETADSTVAICAGLTFKDGTDNLINAALVTMVGITPAQLNSRSNFFADPLSVDAFGVRTNGASFENLIIGDADDGNTPIQEAATYADSIVQNYKDPVPYVDTITYTNPPPGASDAQKALIWEILGGIELSDLSTMTTFHPGGGGFNMSTGLEQDHYVEQIHYDLSGLQGDVWKVDLKITLSSRHHFRYMPAYWRPPT